MKRRHRLLERDLKLAKNVPLLSINLIDYSHVSHYLYKKKVNDVKKEESKRKV